MNFPTKIGVDSDGYILNQTSKNKINSTYLLLLNKLTEILKQCTDDKLHSIYVYGSVARGEEVLGKSDIDLSIILTSPLTSTEIKILNKEKIKFINANHHIVPKVDFDIGILDEVLKKDNLYYWGFWIKHICTCIYGEDLSVNFPRMKPNINICKSLNQDIVDTLKNYRKQIVEGDFDDGILITVLKRIIRGAYCLVSVEDESWSINIQENLVILNHYFPKEESFKKIRLILRGEENLIHTEILEYIDYFTIWFNQNIV